MAKQASEQAAKKAAKYHLYVEGDADHLAPLGQYEGKNAEAAVGVFLAEKNGSHKAVRDRVRKGEQALVVVPDRNFTRVSAEVEVKERVKLTVKS